LCLHHSRQAKQNLFQKLLLSASVRCLHEPTTPSNFTYSRSRSACETQAEAMMFPQTKAIMPLTVPSRPTTLAKHAERHTFAL